MSKTEKTEQETSKTKTYILDLNDGNMRKVTVPANWKLTFGPTIPYAGKGMVPVANGGTALRFYEGSKEHLRAAFTDVKAFRDSEMAVSERRTEVQRKVMKKEGPGGAKDVFVEARVTEWVNPDEADIKDKEAATPYLAMINTTD